MVKRRKPRPDSTSENETFVSKEVGKLGQQKKRRRKKKKRKKSAPQTETPRWLATVLIAGGLVVVTVLVILLYPTLRELNTTDDDYYVLKMYSSDPVFSLRSPTAEDLRAGINDLPWNESETMAVLESPWRHDDTFEEIRLDQHDWGDDHQANFRIYWVRFAQDEKQESFQHSPIDSVDAAAPIFEAFLNDEENWDKSLEWKEAEFEEIESK